MASICIGGLPEACAPTAEMSDSGPARMKNARVHARAQLHTWGAPCVLNFVLFSAAQTPFDKFCYFIRSNTAIHPIFPPPPKECILLCESSTGTKKKSLLPAMAPRCLLN